jgi:hypothetical protein
MAILGSTTLTGCNSIPNFIGTGTLMLFQQTSAPVNWVKQTTHNDKALRLVNGTVSFGGSIAFTSAFPNSLIPISASSPYTATVGNTTLIEDQIPSHTHPTGSLSFNIGATVGPAAAGSASNTGSTGGSGAHTHPWDPGSVSLSTNLDLRVQYVDVIICSKS